MKEKLIKINEYVKENKENVKLIVCAVAAATAGVIMGRYSATEDIKIEQNVFENDKLIKNSYTRIIR